MQGQYLQGGEIVKSGDLYYILYTIPGSIPISYEATEQDIRGLFPLTFDQQQFRSLTKLSSISWVQ